MSCQGKELSPEFCEIVVKLKKHYDDERKGGPFVSTKNSSGRVAGGLDISPVTVRRLMAGYNRAGEKVAVLPKKRRGRQPRQPVVVCPNAQTAIRKYIRDQNLKGQRVSLERVRAYISEESELEIPKTTLWRALSRWGFTYGQGRRRDSLKEQDYVIRARRTYLRAIRNNRNQDGSTKRPEVYLDETYINKNHSSHFTWYLDEDGPWVNKPSGVGPRLIVVHAISRNGLTDGAELVFEAKKRTGDYHGKMNWKNFSKWFSEQLLPNIPTNSIIVMDNARYHNVLVANKFPSSTPTKEELQLWLTHNGHSWCSDLLKSKLAELCRKYAPVPEFRVDRLAFEAGHTILRTPQYHPELQPIETCWAVVKNYMADNCDYTMRGLRERLPQGFSKITASCCAGIIKDVRKQEDAYWIEDEELDELFDADKQEEELAESYDESMAEETRLAEI